MGHEIEFKRGDKVTYKGQMGEYAATVDAVIKETTGGKMVRYHLKDIPPPGGNHQRRSVVTGEDIVESKYYKGEE